MKFNYGARVKILSGFYEGSRATVISCQETGILDAENPIYSVLVDIPEYANSESIIQAVGHLKIDRPERELEALK